MSDPTSKMGIVCHFKAPTEELAAVNLADPKFASVYKPSFSPPTAEQWKAIEAIVAKDR